MTSRTLTPIEARVLAVLLEKQHTVPDSYPLSLNALTLGCNQKTARDPVMSLSEAEVLTALDGLKALSLIHEVSGSRVVRFDHNTARGLGVPSQSAALLCMLVLRGPQTAAELRLHTERLHRFADISSVEGFLEEMAEREPRRVLKLPRAPGARESRWVHLLCGEVDVMGFTSAQGQTGAAASPAAHSQLEAELAELRAEQARFQAELLHQREQVQQLANELGIHASPNG